MRSRVPSRIRFATSATSGSRPMSGVGSRREVSGAGVERPERREGGWEAGGGNLENLFGAGDGFQPPLAEVADFDPLGNRSIEGRPRRQ